MPSDYRFNPYNNVLEPVQITNETVIVPSNAPYTVRLNEVPLKESPSSLNAKFENDTALVEVSASPAASQFWPDYNTADANWNTGTLRFNAADAGKVVKVSYKGTGTLASIKANTYPACWFERGDASLGDKICTNGEVFEGMYNYRNFTVPSGVTIYINKTAKICCTESFINNGTVSGQGRGGSGSGQDRVGGQGCLSGGGGGGGGRNRSTTTDIAAGYVTLDAITNSYQGSANIANITLALATLPNRIYGGGGSGGSSWGDGSYGGSGGGGGAGFTVLAKSVHNAGVIIMSGTNGGAGTSNSGGGGGGGGGGVAILIADAVKNTGTININGGGGGSGYAWGGNGYAGWYKVIEVGG